MPPRSPVTTGPPVRCRKTISECAAIRFGPAVFLLFPQPTPSRVPRSRPGAPAEKASDTHLRSWSRWQLLQAPFRPFPNCGDLNSQYPHGTRISARSGVPQLRQTTTVLRTWHRFLVPILGAMQRWHPSAACGGLNHHLVDSETQPSPVRFNLVHPLGIAISKRRLNSGTYLAVKALLRARAT
jgi:hypothetical protein